MPQFYPSAPAAGAAGFSSKARAYRVTTTQTILDVTYTKVQLNAESYDVDGEFDHTINYRFTATAAGYYLITSQIWWVSAIDQSAMRTYIYKNGVAHSLSNVRPSGIGYHTALISDIIYLAAGDYVELWCYQDSGSAKDIQVGEGQTFMAIHRLS